MRSNARQCFSSKSVQTWKIYPSPTPLALHCLLWLVFVRPRSLHSPVKRVSYIPKSLPKNVGISIPNLGSHVLEQPSQLFPATAADVVPESVAKILIEVAQFSHRPEKVPIPGRGVQLAAQSTRRIQPGLGVQSETTQTRSSDSSRSGNF